MRKTLEHVFTHESVVQSMEQTTQSVSQSVLHLSGLLLHSLAFSAYSAYACILLHSLGFSCILLYTLEYSCRTLHSVAYSCILLYRFVLHTLAYIHLWYLYALVDCQVTRSLFCLGLLSCFDISLSYTYSIIKDHFSHLSTRYVIFLYCYILA